MKCQFTAEIVWTTLNTISLQRVDLEEHETKTHQKNSNTKFTVHTRKVQISEHLEQVAQLSQRDRAAGWVSYGQKWKTGTGRQRLRTL